MSAVDLLTIPVRTIDGRDTTLEAYRGHVLLIVNVASRCGFTSQYRGLEALYQRHRDRGFVVLGFPCNQFGRQEPGSDQEIAAFCSVAYNVTFPMFSRIDVNGPAAHPLYRALTKARRGLLGRAAVAWNFTKFLVDRRGHVVARYGSRESPESIEPEIVRVLEAGAES